jgi:putative heme-binding domain-containing protein
MVAGTGEAPSGILAYESDGLPEEYLGNLLVTSWGDHRIDRFRLQPKGTSFTSLAEPLITGGENFRPVGIATAPDGSLFCTDWVLRDYKLHGHGRIWRIAPKEKRTTPVVDLASIQTNFMAAHISSARLDVRRFAHRIALAKLSELTKKGSTTEAAEFQKGLYPSREISPRTRMESIWALSVAQPLIIREGQPRLPWHDLMTSSPIPSQVLFGTDDVGKFSPNLGNPLGRFKSLAEKLLVSLHDHENNNNSAAYSLLPILTRIGELETNSQQRENLPSQRANPPKGISVAAENAPFKNDPQFVRLVLESEDPFVFSLATTILSDLLSQDDIAKYLFPDATPDVKASSPRVRQAMLLAARKQAPKEDRLLRVALADPDPDVRRLAVQWAAEEKLTDLKPRVEAVFDGKGMTPDLFLATLAALEMLDGKKPEDFDKTPAGQYVVPLLKDEKRSPAVRAQALRLVSPTDKSLDAPFFARLLKSDNEPLRVETVRTLQAAKPEVSSELLRELVANDQLDVQLRAEALVGLAAVAKTEPIGGPSRQLLKKFLNNNSLVPLRFEALRAARPLIADDAELRDGVLDIAKTLSKLADGEVETNLADQIALAFAEAKLDLPQSIKLNTNEKPKDRREWMDQLARGGNVDPAAGRRIFFHPNGPGCFKCHTIDGRGGRIGPDLSRTVGTMNRVQLIQSIMEPSREIAPQFVSWTFELKDGRVVTGMVVHENEGKTIIGDAEGKLIEFKTLDIESRTPQKISVMPDKLADRMTLQELRDLLAFLDAQR